MPVSGQRDSLAGLGQAFFCKHWGKASSCKDSQRYQRQPNVLGRKLELGLRTGPEVPGRPRLLRAAVAAGSSGAQIRAFGSLAKDISEALLPLGSYVAQALALCMARMPEIP